jgi:hypothetical protein
MSHFSALMILFHRSNSLQDLRGAAEYVCQLRDEHTRITDKLKFFVLAVFFSSLPALCIVLAFEKFSPCTTARSPPTHCQHLPSAPLSLSCLCQHVAPSHHHLSGDRPRLRPGNRPHPQPGDRPNPDLATCRAPTR